ncbi:unnamed protein product, partial [Oikopleura dioica]
LTRNRIEKLKMREEK